MENKTLLNFEKRYKTISDELLQIKNEFNFDNMIVDYKKIKKQLWKINEEIKNNTDPSRDEELKEKLEEINKIKKELSIEFKKIEVVENKLYSVKKSLINYVSSLDKRKNSNDYIVESLKNKNIMYLERVDKNAINVLKNKLQQDKNKKEEIINKIKSLKEEKKPYNYLSYELSESNRLISKTKTKIKISERTNEEKIIKIVERNKKVILTKKEVSKKLEIEISYSLNLLNEIDKNLASKDDDEVNKEASFIVKHLDVFYGQKQALFNVNITLPKNKVIAIIGPSGCGKSTFLRTLNRINDNVPTFKAKGKILLEGEYDIFKLRSIVNRYDKIELSTLRTKVGMIFQQPNPFPMSISKNVQYGPKVKGIKNKVVLKDITENSLKDAGIWEEVKDNLKSLGTSLSGGQQQRLCIARAIANKPEVLLMDEPTSALDPIAAKKIEDLILKLKENYTIIMVTHSMQQAQRISDYTAFFYQGELIEYGETKQVFESPSKKETSDYITGKFG